MSQKAVYALLDILCGIVPQQSSCLSFALFFKSLLWSFYRIRRRGRALWIIPTAAQWQSPTYILSQSVCEGEGMRHRERAGWVKTSFIFGHESWQLWAAVWEHLQMVEKEGGSLRMGELFQNDEGYNEHIFGFLCKLLIDSLTLWWHSLLKYSRAPGKGTKKMLPALLCWKDHLKPGGPTWSDLHGLKVLPAWTILC